MKILNAISLMFHKCSYDNKIIAYHNHFIHYQCDNPKCNIVKPDWDSFQQYLDRMRGDE